MPPGHNRGMARAVRTGDEQDVFTGWRKLYKYTQRAGACKRVKRRANRRDRREAKLAVRQAGTAPDPRA
jgi:hypothetical protein